MVNQEIYQNRQYKATLQLPIDGVTPLCVGGLFHHSVWPEQGPRKVEKVEWIISEKQVDVWVEKEEIGEGIAIDAYMMMARKHNWKKK